MKYTICLLLIICFYLSGYSQDISISAEASQKGKFFIYWGWNNASYSKSDIRFEGTDYNFKLYDVVAKDRQSKFDLIKYISPKTFTIPQYNFRLGYFFKENYSISLGADHMKYVVQANQHVKINGEINKTENIFNGTYENENIELSPNFLEFEHTDGLNYINVELRRFDKLFSIGKYANINLTEGVGFGALFPKTNTKLFNQKRYDEFHLTGYGVSAVVGLNVNFLKHFFIQYEVKYGYINMPNIRTTQFEEDSASQHFSFLQTNFSLGGNFRLF